MQAGHAAEAVRLFRRAVALRPGWAEGWWFIGTTSFDAGKFTVAKDAFQHFVSVEHKQPGPGFGMLGLCEFQLHHYKLSLNALERGRVLGLGQNWDFTQTVLYHAGILYTFFGEPAVGLQRLTLVANRLAAAPRVLVLHEPTRGVDVGARAQIHETIRQVARDGTAVVLATTDIEEVVAVSDRVLVLREGQIVCELSGRELTEDLVLSWAAEGGDVGDRRIS